MIAILAFSGWCRANETDVRTFFSEKVYGELPPKPAKLTFECRERDGVRGRYVIRAEDVHGVWSFDVDVYLPMGRVGKTPVFVYPNFFGNDDLKPQRAPVGEILARGYGFATYCYKDLYPDKGGRDCAADSVWRIFAADKVPTEKLAHPAWAWGGMRVRDLLETLSEVDQRKVAVVGQSRMGKNATVIGVNDTRFSLVCANCGGTKWLRHLPNLKFPSWFSANLRKWVRNDRTGVAADELEKTAEGRPALPYEQSDYLALIAPRTLVISAADRDIWAPANESSAVWRRTSELMRANGGECLWHLKKGEHSITPEDWSAFMDAADRLWRRSPLVVDLPIRGTLVPRRSGAIRSSNWRLGCETLDRDFADFEAYKGYLAPLGIRMVRLQGGRKKTPEEIAAFNVRTARIVKRNVPGARISAEGRRNA